MSAKLYLVAEGTASINGQPVPSDRIMKLTDLQARFDLSLGRLTPYEPPKSPARKTRKPKA